MKTTTPNEYREQNGYRRMPGGHPRTRQTFRQWAKRTATRKLCWLRGYHALVHYSDDGHGHQTCSVCGDEWTKR